MMTRESAIHPLRAIELTNGGLQKVCSFILFPLCLSLLQPLSCVASPPSRYLAPAKKRAPDPASTTVPLRVNQSALGSFTQAAVPHQSRFRENRRARVKHTACCPRHQFCNPLACRSRKPQRSRLLNRHLMESGVPRQSRALTARSSVRLPTRRRRPS